MSKTRKLIIYWVTNDRITNDKIRERFGIPNTMTVNGETEAEIKEEDMQLLEETERRGFIHIRYRPGHMPRDTAIRRLLCSVLQGINAAMSEMDIDEETEFGTLHIPAFRYTPTFEFTDEDIELIKWLAEEEAEDFSMLIE